MTQSIGVSNFSLLLAFALVLLAILINSKEKLGLSKEILFACLSMVIQLTLVGYVLKYIFQVNQDFLTLAMILFIIFNASVQANKRNPKSENPKFFWQNLKQASFWKSFLAIFVSTAVTAGILLASAAIKFTPSHLIPISGMIASNSMIAIGLCYQQMSTQFLDQRQQILEKLALGAPVKLAVDNILRQSIRMALQPTIDSVKTVGLVSLPGMMSGLIFAGVNPVDAIKYQIMVMFMLLSATSLGAVIAAYLAYKDYFNERAQLKSPS